MRRLLIVQRQASDERESEPDGIGVHVKVADVIRALERDGWELSRTRGSHRQYKHAQRPGKVTVPGKPSDTLHPKTLASILRQAGMEKP